MSRHEGVSPGFAALSYDGTLTISVITDPDRLPEHACSLMPSTATCTSWELNPGADHEPGGEPD